MVHNKINHKFNFPEFEWEKKENYQPCIKLSFFFKKLPTVDDDHFQMHYNHVHSDLTVASKKFNVVKVQRYLYQSPAMKQKVKDLGMEVLDFDAVSQIWVKSWDDWEEFSTGPEYAAALMPDAANFMDTNAGIKVMAG
ncbi:hypothetical protein P154DRAFT_570334 [Amniculicola lignicola CBS 123094]|uniref:EthD domain-containing protein n=1 Tax=Amniculicola lignicola CBS 123094 TaxID=1392246 RepID=A0A6A5WX01_9PLEO|nr:hypothetical protein P154DRAFT_570334 [Amniculicola lignicola CBS 123094]